MKIIVIFSVNSYYHIKSIEKIIFVKTIFAKMHLGGVCVAKGLMNTICLYGSSPIACCLPPFGFVLQSNHYSCEFLMKVDIKK
jgi:hypothetical protein